MSNIALQLVELGAISSLLVRDGQSSSSLKVIEVRILFKLQEFGSDADKNEGMSVEELARSLYSDRSSISRQLAKLSSNGIVCIAPPLRRTSGYRLTSAGQQALRTLDADLERVSRLIRIAILEKDGDMLKARLGKILQLMPNEYTEDVLNFTRLIERKRSR